MVNRETHRMDEKIKDYFRVLEEDETYQKNDGVQLKDFGLFMESRCPLFSDDNEIVDYDCLNFDLLHVLDGVTTKLYEIISTLLGKRFDRLTIALGNTT